MTNGTDTVSEPERVEYRRGLVEENAGEARAFDGLLATSGLLSLKSDATVEAQEAALQAIASAATDLTPLRRALLRDQAVHALKRNGFESPARLVDIALTRNDNADGATGGSDPLVSAPHPWPQAVDGAGLLSDIEAAILAHAVLPEGAAVAMGLWILHTYCLDAAAITPRLAIVSPTKRCGKTTVLKLLGALACKPLAAASLTPAVLYRVVEAFAPTILVDEADTFLAEQDELRGILNAGHDRHSAVVPRCVGDDFEPKVFRVFGAVAIAAIGKLPDTLMDRSVVIEMKRKAPAEKLQKLRRRQREALAALPRQCARWAADSIKALGDREPHLPDELDDRAADNWEPLLAIAEQVGGPWPARARATALLLSGGRSDSAETGDAGVQLLADVRAVFADGVSDRTTTKSLLAALTELEGRPWAEWNRGRPITPRQLGTLLGRFGIKPGTIRVGDTTPKGYVLSDLVDAFGRYLPDGSATSATTSKLFDNQVEFDPPQAPLSEGQEDGRNRLDFADVADVAARTPEREPGCDDDVPF
jgi:putative DNA primase/helicase